MGKGSAPSPPDPAATAQAQAGANKEAVRESALMNQIAINAPGGRQYYTGTLGAPDRALNIELSPAGQEAFQGREQLAALLGGFGAETLGPQVLETLGGTTPTTVADATFERGMGRLQPEYDEAREQLNSRLLGQGVPIGSRAYEQAMGSLGRQQDRAMTDLALGSELAGYGESRAQRSQAINELASLLQGSAAIGGPPQQMPAQYQVAAPDIAGLTAAQYGGNLNAYNTRAQQLGGLYGLAGTLGAAGIGLL